MVILNWNHFLNCLFNFNLLLGWAMWYICLCLWLWYVFIIFIYLFIFCYVILFSFPFKQNFRILVVNWRQTASFIWNSLWNSLSMKEYMIVVCTIMLHVYVYWTLCIFVGLEKNIEIIIKLRIVYFLKELFTLIFKFCWNSIEILFFLALEIYFKIMAGTCITGVFALFVFMKWTIWRNSEKMIYLMLYQVLLEFPLNRCQICFRFILSLQRTWSDQYVYHLPILNWEN